MFRSPKTRKAIAVTLLTLFVHELLVPTITFASGGGPGQQETAGFAQAGASQMVDPFTGDFSYNIPLMSVGGYPLNLSYNANIGMETEASWVGLGWSLNPGSIDRTMRGLPDEFKGDTVLQTYKIRNQKSRNNRSGQEFSGVIPLGLILKLATAGSFPIDLNLGTKFGFGKQQGFNNYTGWEVAKYHSVDFFVNAGYSPDLGIKIAPNVNTSASTGFTFEQNSKTGFGINPRRTFGASASNGIQSLGGSVSISKNYSTRAGLTSSTITRGVSESVGYAYPIESNGESAGVSTGVSFGSSTSSSTSVTYGTPSYTPFNGYNRVSTGFTDVEHDGKVMSGGLRTHYYTKSNSTSTQQVWQRLDTLNAYGYLNTFEIDQEENGQLLRDFNTENGIVHFYETMPNLPPSQYTKDLYRVAAQGLAGSFQPFLNNTGRVFNGKKKSESYHGNVLTRRGKGDYTTIAFFLNGLSSWIGKKTYAEKTDGLGSTVTKGESGNWNLSNQADDRISAPAPSDLQPEEHFYFQQAGEKTIFLDSIYGRFGGEYPAKLALLPKLADSKNRHKSRIELTEYLRVWNKKGQPGFKQDSLPNTDWSDALLRNPRNTIFQPLTAQNATHFALTKEIRDYKEFQTGSDGSLIVDELIDRVDEIHKKHHFSEVTVETPVGARYVFGTPVYNIKKKDVSFNVSGRQLDTCTATAVYVPGIDNSVQNKQGRNQLYQANELPSHTQSHLLSAVLSSDYADLTGDGITDDDPGSYTKFNYSKLHDNYKWRIPYSKGVPGTSGYPEAALNLNVFSDSLDDVANYSYGEKEIWYMHSIESKNTVAEFYLSDREDGFGVKGEDGELDQNAALKKLDKIVLFAKKDREENGLNAIPIQTVYFEYDYSLCPGVPHNKNGGGKLTLKKVWSTSRNSKTGYLQKHEFLYENNLAYDRFSVDRWGNYKENKCSLPNNGFPYSTDSKPSADQASEYWKLSRILLPSGAEMKIEYEADEYAFVQDKRAMKMFNIQGLGASPSDFSTTNPDHWLYGPLNGSRDHLFIELEDPILGATQQAEDQFFHDYLEGQDSNALYFSCLVDLNGAGSFDRVEGYSKVLDFGLVGSAPYTHAWIKLKEVDIIDKDDLNEKIPWASVATVIADPNSLFGSPQNSFNTALQGNKIQPIARAAWQFARLNAPETVFPPLNCNGSDLTCWEAYVQQNYDLDFDAFLNGGLNVAFFNKGFANSINLTRSFIRLHKPDNRVFGGNHRVKSITVKDGWGDMGGIDQSMGTVYNYDLVEDEDTITSGIAAYEPFAGNDVNPLFQPRYYKVSHLLYPDDHSYMDHPIGESFYPSPTVGYRQVTVKQIPVTNVSRSGTGKKVYEFYTAKEFPMIVYKTPLGGERIVSDPKEKGYTDLTMDLYAASQGFSIIKNDMHGKLKAMRIFDETNTQIHSTTHHYKSKPYGQDALQLDNEVDLIQSDGLIGTGSVGQTAEVLFEEKLNKQHTAMYFESQTTNLSSLVIGFNKSINASRRISGFGSSVITKSIQKFGILESTTVQNFTAIVKSTNLLWDPMTGQVLLSSTENDFNDPVYFFNYPAYWGYEELGPAYQNSNAGFISDELDANGKLHFNGIGKPGYFRAGDRLAIKHGNNNFSAWVTAVDPVGVTLVQEDGTLPAAIANGAYIEVRKLRSGYQNQQAFSMGGVSTLKDPRQNGQLVIDTVLSASAVEFAEQWQTYAAWDTIPDTLDCAPLETIVTCDMPSPECNLEVGETVNPFINGLRGHWRPVRSYAYQEDRLLASVTPPETNLRTDGQYVLTPFWVSSGGKMVKNDGAAGFENWIDGGEVTISNPYSGPLESRDALGLYSSAIPGYNHTAVKAQAGNARLKDIAYDGFEDYLPDSLNPECHDNHFNFRDHENDITADYAHTGRYSLKIASSSDVKTIRPLSVSDTLSDYLSYPYALQPGDRVPGFSPERDCDDRKFLLSCWVKLGDHPMSLSTYADVDVEVEIDCIVQPIISEKRSAIIDGWQKIDLVFAIPSYQGRSIQFKVKNAHSTETAYVDDFRVHPYLASMGSYVYDATTLQLRATLDDRNFATIYDYDASGALVGVRVETSRGIKTVSESRGGGLKR